MTKARKFLESRWHEKCYDFNDCTK